MIVAGALAKVGAVLLVILTVALLAGVWLGRYAGPRR